MDHTEHTPARAVEAEAFAQEVIQNPMEALQRFRQLEEQNATLRAADSNTPITSSSEQSLPPRPTQAPSESSELINALVYALNQRPPPATTASAPTIPTRLSEKLPDIDKYEGDRDNLDAWEQSLVQRMHVNHDRYPTDLAKIAYAESRLTIGKKASNLMMPYRIDGICTLSSFDEYRQRLRQCCGNPFEEQDARTYLQEELKQDKMSFLEYYQLFCKKKERSRLDDVSLVDCYRRNVSYQLQVSALPRTTMAGHRPITFQDYTEVFRTVDEELRQIQYRLPRVANNNNSAAKPKPAAPVLSSLSRAVTPVVPASTPFVAVGGDPMDLSSAIAIVQGKPLSTPGVKDICIKWKLCFYCKQQHLGKTAKECPNKKASALRVIDTDDTSSVDGGVSLTENV